MAYAAWQGYIAVYKEWNESNTRILEIFHDLNSMEIWSGLCMKMPNGEWLRTKVKYFVFNILHVHGTLWIIITIF